MHAQEEECGFSALNTGMKLESDHSGDTFRQVEECDNNRYHRQAFYGYPSIKERE